MYSKKVLVVCCFVVLFLISPLKAEIVNIEMGMCYLPNPTITVYPGCELDVGSSAFLFGFSIPVNIPHLDVHFRVEKAYHDAPTMNYYAKGKLYYTSDVDYLYTYNVNELLVGKRFSINSDFTGLPQVGLGYSHEKCGSDENGYWGEAFWFISGSMLIQKQVSKYSIGFRIHTEYGVRDIDDYEKKSTLKIKTGLVFSI